MDQNGSPSFLSLTKKEQIKTAFRSFTKKQLKVFGFFAALLIISTVVMLYKINNHFIVTIPAHGGSLNEGIIGTPRFINPVLAMSDADKDVTSLVYSGLLKKDMVGNIVPDLAESFDISTDGLTYTFIISSKAYFHDGKPVTSDDVVFTIEKIQDDNLKSPKEVNWTGVTIEKENDNTVIFTLKHPFASFLENATVGILPSHIWKNIRDDEWTYSDYNAAKAIGSGPFKISSITKNKSGVPSSYDLKSFGKYISGEPYIGSFSLYFYSNEKDLADAIESGQVDQATGLSPERTRILEESGTTVITAPLPRVFGMFFNQTEAPIFADHKVIAALDKAINKKEIVSEALHGYGEVIDSPLPSTHQIETGEDNYDPSKALLELKALGWIPNTEGQLIKTDPKKKTTQTLSFSLATGNTSEFIKACELIKADLEKIGVTVELKKFEIGTLKQSVIRPRKYDALFFGEIINHDSDLFAFWHSSQRNDPGLNIAMYANAKTDKLLEAAEEALDEDDRKNKLADFKNEIKKDSPAIFIYSPLFTYIIPHNDKKGITLPEITSQEDRFTLSPSWFTKEDHVWKFFASSESDFANKSTIIN